MPRGQVTELQSLVVCRAQSDEGAITPERLAACLSPGVRLH